MRTRVYAEHPEPHRSVAPGEQLHHLQPRARIIHGEKSVHGLRRGLRTCPVRRRANPRANSSQPDLDAHGEDKLTLPIWLKTEQNTAGPMRTDESHLRSTASMTITMAMDEGHTAIILLRLLHLHKAAFTLHCGLRILQLMRCIRCLHLATSLPLTLRPLHPAPRLLMLTPSTGAASTSKRNEARRSQSVKAPTP